MAKKETKENTGFALGKENYKLMAIGFAIIVIGFILLLYSVNFCSKSKNNIRKATDVWSTSKY